VAAVTLNQLGLLPVSAVLAGILFALKVNFGTGTGRAYLVSSFYTWYRTQTPDDQKAIKDAAAEYAIKSGAAAQSGAAAAKEAGEAAAAVLAPLLAKGASSAESAFKAIAKAVRAKEPKAISDTAEADAEKNAVTALTEGGRAAAIAASAAEGGMEATTGGNRRKTKKVKSKRRMTRRRKATKVMGAPVFVY
jgi:hypothetical protein